MGADGAGAADRDTASPFCEAAANTPTSIRVCVMGKRSGKGNTSYEYLATDLGGTQRRPRL
jgi:hypothetical protein